MELSRARSQQLRSVTLVVVYTLSVVGLMSLLPGNDLLVLALIAVPGAIGLLWLIIPVTAVDQRLQDELYQCRLDICGDVSQIIADANAQPHPAINETLLGIRRALGDISGDLIRLSASADQTTTIGAEMAALRRVIEDQLMADSARTAEQASVVHGFVQHMGRFFTETGSGSPPGDPSSTTEQSDQSTDHLANDDTVVLPHLHT